METLLGALLIGLSIYVALTFAVLIIRFFAERDQANRNDESKDVGQANPPSEEIEPEVKIVKEKVIERQTLVIRCQFCGTLTPADLKACKECGAKL